MQKITKKALLECSNTKKYQEEELPPDVSENLEKVIIILNKFQGMYGMVLNFTCSYRDEEHNTMIRGAKNSDHCKGFAVDISDLDRGIAAFCMKNLEILENLGIWLEHPAFTKNWVHFTINPKKIRAFKPSINSIPTNNKFFFEKQPINVNLINRNEPISKITKQKEQEIESLQKSQYIQKNQSTSSFFNFMPNSLIQTLLEKGIDLGTSFIPGGSLVQSAVKSIAKYLLGDENADEQRVLEAVNSANFEQLEQIRLEISKIESQIKVEEEDTKQALELTKQKDIDLISRQIDFIQNLPGKEKIITAILFYLILSLLILYYQTSDFDIFTKHTVISLLSVVALLPFSPYIGGGIFNRILNSLCDIFLNIIEIGKGFSSIPRSTMQILSKGIFKTLEKRK